VVAAVRADLELDGIEADRTWLARSGTGTLSVNQSREKKREGCETIRRRKNKRKSS
jgi:hypothetical protein